MHTLRGLQKTYGGTKHTKKYVVLISEIDSDKLILTINLHISQLIFLLDDSTHKLYLFDYS